MLSAVTRTNGPAGNFIKIVVLATSKLSFTGRAMVLNATVKVVLNWKLEMLALNGMETCPASPCGVMSNEPLPPESLRISVPSLWSERPRFATATRTTFLFAKVVICWKVKSARTVTSRMVNATFVPETSRNGPATKSMVTVVPPTLNDSLTATFVLLIFTPNVPEKLTPEMFWMATVALSCPANPSGVMRREPVPLDTRT